MVDMVSEASIAPQTSLPSNAFTGSVYVDFEIPKSIDILKSCVLVMQFDNGDAKPLIMPPILTISPHLSINQSIIPSYDFCKVEIKILRLTPFYEFHCTMLGREFQSKI